MCLQCLSHTGPAPTHGMCALPAHTAQALGCSTRNHPRPALGCMHLPGLSCSGSGTQVVLRDAEMQVGPAFCALPRSEQLRWWGVRGAWSLRLIASPLPAARFSGCTTSAPSQANVDHPEPQEVLVSKEACLQFVDNVSLGPRLPPSGSGCLSLDGDDLQLAISVQSLVLCAGLVVS